MSTWMRAGRRLGVLTSLLGAFGLAGANLRADVAKPEGNTLEQDVTQGALRIVKPDGVVVECPLKHTDVQADIAGFMARVKVTQTFQNHTKEKIEAVYVFPLPHEAAVDEMTMTVGERKVVGLIKRRAEARAIYEAALHAGQTAAVLEQERPNIFTQSVGNIEPGQEVKIQISYVDPLKYDLGTYEFHFPMVVGPRYIPGGSIGSAPPTPPELKGKVSPPVADTDRVPDASKITPPALKPGVRNGHDVSLAIKLDAGVPIQNLTATNHKADINRIGDRNASVKLLPADSVPNKDFVLRYGVVGKKPEMAMLAHTGDFSGDRAKLGNGYFMLMIQPQEDERLKKSPPREIVFLVDVSGSMSGEPTAKVIESMQGMLKLCREKDTIQVITFASQAFKLFDKPVPVTDVNIGKALGFTAALQGGGGTEMLKGVKLAIDEPIDKERLRIVVMLTDGYIGNEAEIIEHVGKNCGDQVRFWCVGIGSAPNMFLVDGVAKQGGGMGKKLGLKDESEPLMQEIMTRIQRAQLAKIQIDWGGLKVSETYPARLPELWAGRPVIVYGRYNEGGASKDDNWQAQITVSGNVEGETVRWPLAVSLPKKQAQHDVLAKVWARQKIEDLMQQSYYQGSPAVEEMVTALALDYRLMSQYTSFVAVDSKTPATEPARPPRRMLVPLPLPEGTRWEGFFGDDLAEDHPIARREALTDRYASSVKGMKDLSRNYYSRAKLSDRAPMAGKRLDALQSRFAVPALHARLSAASAMPTGGGIGGGGGGYGFSSVADGRLGRGGRLAEGTVTRGLRLFSNLSDTEGDFDFAGRSHFALAAISPQAGKWLEAARKSYESATNEKAPADRAAKARLLAQASWLDTAAASVGHSDGSIAAQAIERLEQLHNQDVTEWTAKLPALKTKLQLVLRDQSLEDALAQVAKAANLKIQLTKGSAEDVAALLGESPRVSYLDLRGATVAQALDWILQPARLAWSPDKESIVATSGRRSAGESGWVYDVSAIAIPAEEELAKLEPQKAQAEALRIATELLTALRKEIKAEDESSVQWFAPGQLLVFGSPERHAAVAQAIQTLESGKTKPEGALAAITEATRKRFAARQEKLTKGRAAEKKYAAAIAHNHFSWQLMASAAAGKLDLEALTELQIAWKSPSTAELLDGPSKALVMRSLWSVCEASRTLPAEKELADLATAARKQTQAAVGPPSAAVEKESQDQAVLTSVLFAALANPSDAALTAKTIQFLAPREGVNAANADLRTLGRLLLGKPTDADRQLLTAIIARDEAGPDQIALTALACRKLGGVHWEQFRAASRDLLGSQPLPGELVVLVNRLGLLPASLAQAKP